MQRYFFRHRIILKKVTFNVTVLVTVFISDDKCDDIIFKNTVSYNIVRYGTVRYGTVRYGTVRYGTVRYGAVRYGSVRYGSVWYGDASGINSVKYCNGI